jgi:2'-5' RNA ligase
VTDRLFFAFWPDAALRDELAGRVAEWTRGYPCRPQRPDQWHLTVEFVGSVATDRQHALYAAAKAIEGFLDAPEVIVLDRLEHWPRPQVLCVTATTVSRGVAALASALKDALRRHGFEPEQREFRPHLSVARKARQPVAARGVGPIGWPVRTLSLVKSHSDAAGSRYEPCACWNLVQTLDSLADGGRGRGETGQMT